MSSSTSWFSSPGTEDQELPASSALAGTQDYAAHRQIATSTFPMKATVVVVSSPWTWVLPRAVTLVGEADHTVQQLVSHPVHNTHRRTTRSNHHQVQSDRSCNGNIPGGISACVDGCGYFAGPTRLFRGTGPRCRGCRSSRESSSVRGSVGSSKGGR